MKNRKGDLRDEQMPAFIFLLNEIIRTHFKRSFDEISNEEVEEYIQDLDSDRKRSFSITTIRNMFELLVRDSGYRPRKKNVSIILNNYLEYDESFEKFIEENSSNIDTFFSTLNFKIKRVNPANNTGIVTKNIQPISLGGGTVSINLSEGAVAQIIDAVTPVVGNLLLEKFDSGKELIQNTPKSRSELRIKLREDQRQKNIDNVLKKTLEFAVDSVSSEEQIDLDWIMEFFNLAQDCSNERLQYVWAKLLLDEIVEPGAISRRTLGLLKLLSGKEAKSFHALCQCTWKLSETHFGSERMLIKDIDEEGLYSDYTWGFDGAFISHLEESGLITDSQLQLDHRRIYVADFFGERFDLESTTKEQDLYVVALTRAGEDLFKVINPEPNEEYKEVTLDYFRSMNLLK